MYNLPKPLNTSLRVVERQTIPDITKLILKGINDSKESSQILAPHLKKSDIKKTCYAIWRFLKNNVNYVKEPPELQTVKTLSRLLMLDKKGDCKHLSTATASLLLALGIKCKLRLVSFKYYSKEPTHIYCVAKDEKGDDIYIDCVLKNFDDEAPYKHKKDIKLNY